MADCSLFYLYQTLSCTTCTFLIRVKIHPTKNMVVSLCINKLFSVDNQMKSGHRSSELRVNWTRYGKVEKIWTWPDMMGNPDNP